MKSSARRNVIVIRILQLIDLMAPLRHPLPLPEITKRFNAQYGETYCSRTLRRDIAALCDCNLALKVGRGKRTRYVLRLKYSEPHQEAAILIEDALSQ